MPYSEWARRGFIEVTDGSSVDINEIKAKLRWASEMFELRKVAFDPWNFKTTAAELNDEGILCEQVQQGYAALSSATKKIFELYLNSNLWHGNHPVANWCASCATVQGDRKDNIQFVKPERARTSKRIDCMSAMATAMSIANSMMASDSPRPWILEVKR